MRKQITRMLRTAGMDISSQGAGWIKFSSSQSLVLNDEATPTMLQIENQLPAGWYFEVGAGFGRLNFYTIKKQTNGQF
jgi:hypothetical protein